MKTVAIIGAGISGMACAHELSSRFRVTVFEQDLRVGGHVNTVAVTAAGGRAQVDTGFIVYNDSTYPGFSQLLKILGVASKPTRMGLSVRDDFANLEYNRMTLRSVFSQKRNLLNPGFLSMLAEAVRFNREALALSVQDGDETVGAFLARRGFSRGLLHHYFYPMVAAIWSAEQGHIEQMPITFVARFFSNHGFLRFTRLVPWRVIEGGSSRYMEKLLAAVSGQVRLRARVQALKRLPKGVEVRAVGAEPELFDFAIVATHSDEALGLLADATEAERRILAAIRYTSNEAVLHTDTSVLPRNRLAWASWNYLISPRAPQGLISYHMNTVQQADWPEQYCVSLNPGTAVDEAKVLKKISYRHPLFDAPALQSQKRRAEISGLDRVFYCGAYWYNGFHEDGLRSALDVCAVLNKEATA